MSSFTFDGFILSRVCPSHYWPRVEDGTETLCFEAHPIIKWLAKWLAKWLPITPYVEMEVAKYRDADPMQVTATGVIYCSHAQADMIRRAAQAVGKPGKG